MPTIEREQIDQHTLNIVLNLCPDAMLAVTHEQRVLVANAAAASLFGFSSDELIGLPLSSLIPARFRDAHQKHVSEYGTGAHSRGMGTGIPLWGLCKDGSQIPVDISLRPIRTKDGDLILAAVRDISPRHRAEQLLKDKTEALSSALLLSGLGTWEFDLASNRRRYSPELRTLLGASPEDEADLFEQRVHPEDAAALDAATSRALLGGVTSKLRLRVRRENGEYGWFEVQSHLVTDTDGRPVLRGVLQDVTERHRAEQELSDSRAEWRALVEHSPDLIFSLDCEGKIQFLNRAPKEFGAQNPIGSSWFDWVPAEQHDALRTALSRVFATGEAISLDVASRRPDGALVWYATSMGPVLGEGAITGAVVTLRDVTHERQMEAQLVTSDRLASMGMLAAGVAHEINNPLSAVLGNVELALQDLDQIAAPSQARVALRQQLLDVSESAERIRSIAKDLRVFSRHEDNSSDSVDVRKVLESTLRMAQNEIRHRARLICEFADVPPVRGGESRLGQVFLNLLVNAAQAIQEGNADQNEIRVRTRFHSSGYVVVEISDTGVGIPEPVLPRLFTPFMTTKPSGVGTGLGLAICQRIITSFGGKLTVESTLGKGSTFSTFLVPGEASTVTGDERPSTRPPRRRGRVLIVDDDPAVLRTVRRCLSNYHDTTEVGSGIAALDLIRSGERFDVIICDLMMPDCTGVEVFHAIRELMPEQADKIVFLTGGAFTPQTRAFLDQIDNPQLEKPFDIGKVRELVNERLD